MNTLIIFGAKYLYLVAVAIFIIHLIKLPRESRFKTIGFYIINLGAAYIVGKVAGFFYNNPRPFVSEHITPLISHVADNGFPSDHTLLVATLASILYIHNRRLGISVFIIALLVGISRVLAGIHHFVDIFGALAIAMVVTAILHRLVPKLG